MQPSTSMSPDSQPIVAVRIAKHYFFCHILYLHILGNPSHLGKRKNDKVPADLLQGFTDFFATEVACIHLILILIGQSFVNL